MMYGAGPVFVFAGGLFEGDAAGNRVPGLVTTIKLSTSAPSMEIGTGHFHRLGCVGRERHDVLLGASPVFRSELSLRVAHPEESRGVRDRSPA
jgi:hypothetical protein